MILKKIYYHQLQHLEHYQFTSHLLSMAKEANVEKLTAVLKPLEDAFKDEDEAVFPQRGNAMLDISIEHRMQQCKCRFR